MRIFNIFFSFLCLKYEGIASCDLEDVEDDEGKGGPSPRPERGTGKNMKESERTPKELDVKRKGAEQSELEATTLWEEMEKEKEEGERGVSQLRQEKEVEASGWAQEEKEAEWFEVVKEEPQTGEGLCKLRAAESQGNSKKAPRGLYWWETAERERRKKDCERIRKPWNRAEEVELMKEKRATEKEAWNRAREVELRGNRCQTRGKKSHGPSPFPPRIQPNPGLKFWNECFAPASKDALK